MKKYIKQHKITGIICIYAIYVSLGIPDSVLGVAWPSVQLDFQVPTYFGSIIMAIVAILAATSSISYGWILKRVPIENIIVGSCLLTGIGLYIMGLSESFLMLCTAAIPLGIGAGAVDAALNNFVSENLSSTHMIWLHGSWGIGAIVGPSIYSFLQGNGYPWQYSAITIAVIQILLTVILLINRHTLASTKLANQKRLHPKRICGKTQLWIRVLFVFLFSGFDVSINLWMSTYLQNYLHYPAESAGMLMACYYGSVMIGRFIIGLISKRMQLHKLMTYGCMISIIGIVMMLWVTSEVSVCLAIVITGIGMCAIYPFTLFENHLLFERTQALKISSYQVAINLIGSLVLPFLIGLLMTYQSLRIYIWIQLGLLCLTCILRMYLNKMTDDKEIS